MGRKKNKNKHNEETYSTPTHPTDNSQQTNNLNCNSVNINTLLKSNENKLQSKFSCNGGINSPLEESILSQACKDRENKEQKMSELCAQNSKTLPGNGENINSIVNLWMDSIVKMHKNDYSALKCNNIQRNIFFDLKIATRKPSSLQDLSVPPLFNESICFKAVRWLLSGWPKSLKNNEYKRSEEVDFADIMIYGEIILKAWNEKIQVSFFTIIIA